LIRSGQSATGVIGTALAGEVTIARLPVSGAASGSRGLRRPYRDHHESYSDVRVQSRGRFEVSHPPPMALISSTLATH
jgi:hypothetical protein